MNMPTPIPPEKWAYLAVCASMCFLPVLLNAQTAPHQAPAKITEILETNADFAFTDDMGWQADLLESMQAVYGNPGLEEQTEQIMIQFLQSGATYAAKKAIWREFANIVTERSLPVLVELIKKEETAVLSLLILQKADLDDRKILADVLADMTALNQVGIANHLGDRGEENAVPLLQDLSRNNQQQVAEAAMVALGKLGTPQAADALLEAFHKSDGYSLRVLEALLQCAEDLTTRGEVEQARELYQTLLSTNLTDTPQSAALTGLFLLSKDPILFIENQLENSESELRPDIIRLVRKLPANFKDGKQFFEIDKLNLQNRIQLLLLFAEREDSSIRPFALELLDHEEPRVRDSALNALKRVGTSEDVLLLIAHAADANKSEREKTVETLTIISGARVDSEILSRMNHAYADEISVLVDLIRYREIKEAIPTLWSWCKHEDRSIQLEAIRALGTIGSANLLKHAIESLTTSPTGSVRRAWERTVFQLALKAQEGSQFTAVETQLRKAKDPMNLVSFLSILGQARAPAHYTLIKEHLFHPEKTVQAAAIRALSDWQNPSPTRVLIGKFRQSDDDNLRTQALRGALQVMDVDRRMTSDEKLKLLNELMSEFRNGQERALIISGYTGIPTLSSLKALVTLMEQPKHRTEIETSIRSITRTVYTDDIKGTLPWILKAQSLSHDEIFRTWIDDGLRNERFER